MTLDITPTSFYLLVPVCGSLKPLLYTGQTLTSKTRPSESKTLSAGFNNRLLVRTESPKSADSNRTAILTDNMITVLKEFHEQDKLICPIIFHNQSGNYLNISRPQMWLKLIYQDNPLMVLDTLMLPLINERI